MSGALPLLILYALMALDRDNFNYSVNVRTNTATEGYITGKATECTLYFDAFPARFNPRH
jgi:hypothetical protein